MAFAGSGFTNLVASSSEILPSLSSIVAAPWKVISARGRHITSKPTAPGTQTRREVHSVSAQVFRLSKKSLTKSTVIDEQQAQPRVHVPDCLASVPVRMLQPKFTSAAAQHVPTAGAIITSVSRGNLRHMHPSYYAPLLPKFARQYSTIKSIGPLRLQRIPGPLQLAQLCKEQRRSLFGNNNQSTSYLAHIEQTANNNPTSSSAQYAFYSACMRAGRPDIIVTRFESGRYASNQQCENLYGQAVDKLGVGRGTVQGASNLSPNSPGLSADQRQALAQAVAARTRGTNISVNGARGGSGDRDSPFYVVVDESRSNIVFKYVRFLVGLAVFVTIFYMAFGLFIEMSGILKPRGGRQDPEARAEMQTTRFSDVHGCEEAKEELQELVEFLKAPERFSTLGGKLPKGVLLVGPPGTGKTLLARAVAGEAGVPFFYMSGSEFDEVYVGVGAKRVRELFSAARAKAPSIVFIDELDAIGARRNERDAAYVKQTLNQLLTDLDGFDQQSGVIFLAATNFPQLLDKALMRPGRFDRQVHVTLPDVRGRVAILKHHMRNMQLNPDVDATVIARGTPGCSGAELENIVNQAAVHASKHKKKNVSLVDFEWAKDRIMMGAERRSAVIQQKDKLMTAYHEGGHTLVALFTKAATPLYKATIMPRGPALGVTSFLPDMDKVSMAKKEYLASIDVAMGGKVAEEMIYGPDDVTSGASSDLQKATQIAYSMVTQMGFSEEMGDVEYNSIYENLAPSTKQRIDDEVRKIIDESKKRTRALLTEKRKELDLLANALLEYEVLTKAEIEKVVKGEKLPEKKLAAEPLAPMKIPEVPLPIGLPTPPATSQSRSNGPTVAPGQA